jgi:hypothetical protein
MFWKAEPSVLSSPTLQLVSARLNVEASSCVPIVRVSDFDHTTSMGLYMLACVCLRLLVNYLAM